MDTKRVLEKIRNKEGFYRAYKTKAEADASAQQQRREYCSVSVKRIKNFGFDRGAMWGVYRYNKK